MLDPMIQGKGIYYNHSGRTKLMQLHPCKKANKEKKEHRRIYCSCEYLLTLHSHLRLATLLTNGFKIQAHCVPIWYWHEHGISHNHSLTGLTCFWWKNKSHSITPQTPRGHGTKKAMVTCMFKIVFVGFCLITKLVCSIHEICKIQRNIKVEIENFSWCHYLEISIINTLNMSILLNLSVYIHLV
jgi:hypothetical protein